MTKTNQTTIDTKEELDFHYLLGLLPPLYNVPEFAWLPELFSIIGHEKLILLSKYCGGERIRIPTLEQLSDSIEALQWFYDVSINKTKSITDVPAKLHVMFNKVMQIYNARENKALS